MVLELGVAIVLPLLLQIKLLINQLDVCVAFAQTFDDFRHHLLQRRLADILCRLGEFRETQFFQLGVALFE